MSIVFSGGRKVDANGVVEGFWMLVDGDSIAATGTGDLPSADDTVDLAGRTLVPGFIDLHSHGGGGHAFDDGRAFIEAALHTHRQHGTTRSVVSLVASPMPALRLGLAVIAQLAAEDPLVLGSHLEGPYLAAGRRGAHHAAHLRTPAGGEIDELLEASAGTLRQLTIAPELPGAMTAIDALVASGVTVAIGHTDADYDLARAAFDRGARLLTHAFNAMPGIHHRAPGPVVAAFDDERIGLEVILDGEHVHPAVARMAFRCAPGRIALVTDAMAAAGSVDGDYRLGSVEVRVRDGVARLAGGAAIAGSTVTQDAALRRAIGAGIDQVEAVTALTRTPARVLGLGDRLGLLAPGFAADAVLLDADWAVESVWGAGARLR